MTIERVLSIRQPWASLIVDGLKDVENRSWKTAWRGRLLVHSARRPDPSSRQICERLGINAATLPLGHYLGSVEVVDVHLSSESLCCLWGQPGLYHWRLKDPRHLPEPIPGRGQLGLCRTPDEISHRLSQAAGELKDPPDLVS